MIWQGSFSFIIFCFHFLALQLYADLSLARQDQARRQGSLQRVVAVNRHETEG